ncbi:hypothetical protein K1719_023544 [Acacia pycnantha]|nr:hypothetical protein K1719_023544 [Acacia pycnantha]
MRGCDKPLFVKFADPGRPRKGNSRFILYSHLNILSNILGSERAARDSILYSYKHGFSGFAAVVSQSQSKLIADFPGVIRVIPNRILSVYTTRS